MSKKKYIISKTAVLLASEHHSDKKKCYKPFSHTYEPRHEISNNVVCAISKG